MIRTLLFGVCIMLGFLVLLTRLEIELLILTIVQVILLMIYILHYLIKDPKLW